MISEKELLQFALIGYEARVAEIRARLAGTQVEAAEEAPSLPKARQMSAAAKKRIADAQKKRWAEYHAKNAPAAKKATPKKRLSPERRAQLAANLARARAARAAKRKAAA